MSAPPALLLGLAVALGIWVPALATLPRGFAVACVAGALFLTPLANPSDESGGFPPTRLAAFVLGRFVALPAVLYALTLVAYAPLAPGVALLAAVPTGVAAPALTRGLGGNARGAAQALVASTALFVAVVGILGLSFAVPAGLQVAVGAAALGLAPLLAGVALSRALPPGVWRTRAPDLALLLVAVSIAILTAHSWQALEGGAGALAALCAVATCEFAVFYAAAYLFGRDIHLRVSSGFNNNVLGAALAALYFSPLSALFLVIANPVCALSFVIWSTLARRS